MNDDPIPEGWNWRQFALCAQVDIGETWFPEKGGSTRDAKKVCAACPVAAECLDYALEHGERFGIWGGLSERERRRLNHPRVAHRTDPTLPRSPRSTARNVEVRAEVAALTREGLSASEIAVILDMSQRTVVRYRADDREAS